MTTKRWVKRLRMRVSQMMRALLKKRLPSTLRKSIRVRKAFSMKSLNTSSCLMRMRKKFSRSKTSKVAKSNTMKSPPTNKYPKRKMPKRLNRRLMTSKWTLMRVSRKLPLLRMRTIESLLSMRKKLRLKMRVLRSMTMPRSVHLVRETMRKLTHKKRNLLRLILMLNRIERSVLLVLT